MFSPSCSRHTKIPVRCIQETWCLRGAESVLIPWETATQVSFCSPLFFQSSHVWLLARLQTSRPVLQHHLAKQGDIFHHCSKGQVCSSRVARFAIAHPRTFRAQLLALWVALSGDKCCVKGAVSASSLVLQRKNGSIRHPCDTYLPDNGRATQGEGGGESTAGENVCLSEWVKHCLNCTRAQNWICIFFQLRRSHKDSSLCLTRRYRFYFVCLFSPRLRQKCNNKNKSIRKEELFVPSKSLFSLQHHLSLLGTCV